MSGFQHASWVHDNWIWVERSHRGRPPKALRDPWEIRWRKLAGIEERRSVKKFIEDCKPRYGPPQTIYFASEANRQLYMDLCYRAPALARTLILRTETA
jgi:hypothetical protein